MDGKVILEEHFAIPATLGDSQVFGAHVWDTLGPRLIDIQDQRLRLMDESGVEIMILSLNAPAVQAIPDVKRAIAVAREANDFMAAAIAKRPDRFAGFAALPMQDPEAAARGARTLRQGARLRRRAGQRLLPGRRPRHRALLRPAAIPAVLGLVERLGVPFYLHPRNPLPEHGAELRGPCLDDGAELGVRARRPPCTRCG